MENTRQECLKSSTEPIVVIAPAAYGPSTAASISRKGADFSPVRIFSASRSGEASSEDGNGYSKNVG